MRRLHGSTCWNINLDHLPYALWWDVQYKLESGLVSLMGLNFYHMLILDVGDVFLNDS